MVSHKLPSFAISSQERARYLQRTVLINPGTLLDELAIVACMTEILLKPC